MNASDGSRAALPPNVSVLMTAFNSEPYLAEAIDSILEQETRRTWELLFVDDGSTDRSFAIAQRYASRFPGKIQVLQHRGGINRGISASRNLALHHARAPVIAFLDSDDVWLPHHLETQAALLDSLPEIGMVYAGAERWVDFDQPFDEDAARRAHWGSNYLPPLLPRGQPAGVLPRGRLLDWFRADESLVPCICTVLVRAEAARAVGGFCDAFRGLYDDQAFHAKLVQRFDVCAKDLCTARYRQHPGSCCGRSRLSHDSGRRERLQFRRFLQASIGDV